MKGIVLLLLLSIETFMSVSNVMADEEMKHEQIMKALKAYEKITNKVMSAVVEMEDEEAKADVEERDVESPLGLYFFPEGESVSIKPKSAVKMLMD